MMDLHKKWLTWHLQYPLLSCAIEMKLSDCFDLLWIIWLEMQFRFFWEMLRRGWNAMQPCWAGQLRYNLADKCSRWWKRGKMQGNGTFNSSVAINPIFAQIHTNLYEVMKLSLFGIWTLLATFSKNQAPNPNHEISSQFHVSITCLIQWSQWKSWRISRGAIGIPEGEELS